MGGLVARRVAWRAVALCMLARAEFSEREAIDLAFLTTAAYCKRQSVEAWSCGQPCLSGVENVHDLANHSTGAHGYVARFRGQCLLVFRGSESAASWRKDIESQVLTPIPPRLMAHGSCQNCKVGSGFLQQYLSLSPQLLAGLADLDCGDATSPLMLAGHSLGGALALLASLDLLVAGFHLAKVYTFGQPRVGNHAFALAARAQLSQSSLPLYRVTRADDPVVYMPERKISFEAFYHAGAEIYYSKAGTDCGADMCYTICDDAVPEDPQCSIRNGEWQVEGLVSGCAMVWRCGHVLYFHPKKQGLMFPTACDSSIQVTII